METAAQNVAAKVGIDVPTVLAIIEAVLAALGPILANCGKPVPPAQEALAKADGFIGSMAINRGLRANDIRPLSREGRAIHAELVAEAKAADLETAEAFMALAK